MLLHASNFKDCGVYHRRQLFPNLKTLLYVEALDLRGLQEHNMQLDTTPSALSFVMSIGAGIHP